MARSTFVSLLALAAGAFSQTTTTFVDPMTDITFQAFTDPTTGYRFGIALPENPTTDFIGQLHAPLQNGSGWIGADLGAPMVNELLIVAYPSGSKVVSSFRKASAYANPPVYSGNLSLALLPIAKGTSVTGNSFTYTFVCQGCITNTAMSFSSTEAGTVFGWALSNITVATPSSPSSPLNFHTHGYGDYGVNLTEAKSPNYAQWAALATNSTGTSTGAATRPSGVLAGSAIPSKNPSSGAGSCHKGKKGKKGQTGSVVAAPAPAEEAQSTPTGAASQSAPTSTSGEGVGAGFPFPHHYHHHHHHHHNGTGPGFNGSFFGGLDESKPRHFHVGGGAARSLGKRN